tara:strand:+ start:2346 stop:2543 length:198 start_codon:yes stop_codon:yes gene_type:complete
MDPILLPPPLLLAVLARDVLRVRALLARGDVDVDEARLGQTPLRVAKRTGCARITRLLEAAGASE